MIAHMHVQYTVVDGFIGEVYHVLYTGLVSDRLLKRLITNNCRFIHTDVRLSFRSLHILAFTKQKYIFELLFNKN
jgi:hypothetical protein